jgi:hypothetical protein
MKPDLGQSRSEKIPRFHAPQDWTRNAREDAGGKQGGGRAVNGPGPVACDLVQGAEREAAAREVTVERGNAKRDDLPRSSPTPLDPSDLGTQLVQHA